MDAKRFDALSRTLSSSPSRRAALRFLAGGALSGLLAQLGLEGASATHTGCRHTGAGCIRPEQCCSGRCAGNGTCQLCTRASQCPAPPDGEPCKRRVCTSTGRCVIRNRAGSCPDDGDPCTDDVCAAGACTHPAKVCDGDMVCSGQCLCPDDKQECNGACIPKETCCTPCGERCCASGERCIAGRCAPPCGNRCVNTCNACASTFDFSHQFCSGSTGGCASPALRCAGHADCPSDSLCTFTTCPPDGASRCLRLCDACGTTCAPLQTCCGGTCRSTQTDSDHCGDCGISCTGGKFCSGGQCVCDATQRCGADCPCPNGQDCRSNSCCALNGQSCEEVPCCSGVCDRQGEPVCVGS